MHDMQTMHTDRVDHNRAAPFFALIEVNVSRAADRVGTAFASSHASCMLSQEFSSIQFECGNPQMNGRFS